MNRKLKLKKIILGLAFFGLLSGFLIANLSTVKEVRAIPLDTPEKVGILGAGTEDDPYILSEQQHLMYVNTQSAVYIADNNVGKGNSSYYKLANDIVIDDTVFWTLKDGNYSSAWLGGIGRLRPFRGVFDGNDKKVIFNVTNKLPSATFPEAISYGSDFALFGTLSGATVKNLTVEGNLTLAGSGFYVAGIASHAISGSTLLRCTNNMNITLYGVNTSRPAGVVSVSKGSTISECVNNGNITMFNESTNFISGVVTELFESSRIEKSYNTGAITVNQLGEPDMNKSFRSVMGGVVGSAVSSTIQDVYNAGDVILNGNRHDKQPSTVLSSIGGIAGYFDSPDSQIVTGSYNTGNITSYNANAGGIAGQASGISIRSSYNTGTITGLNVGGIVGSLSSKASEVLLTFNTGEVIGKSTKNGIEPGNYGGGLIGVINTPTKVRASYSSGHVRNFSEPAILISRFSATVVLDGLYGYSTANINVNLPLIRNYGGKNTLELTDGTLFNMTLSPAPVVTNLFTFEDDYTNEHFYKLKKLNYISDGGTINTYVFHSGEAKGDLNLYSSLDTARYRMLKSRVADEALSLEELDMKYDLWLKGKDLFNKMTIKFAKPFTYTIAPRTSEFNFLSFKDYQLREEDHNFDPTDQYLYALNLEDEFQTEITAPGTIGDHTVYFKATKIVNKGTPEEGTVEIKREINYSITRATVNRPTSVAVTYNGNEQTGVDSSSALALWKKQWQNHSEEMKLLYGDCEDQPISSAIAYSFLEGHEYGINANMYQTVYALNDSFIWDNNTLYAASVNWRIDKLAIQAPEASDKQLQKGQTVYGIDNYGTILGVNLNLLTEEERNEYFTVAGDVKGSNVGIYYVNFTPTLNFKWASQENNILSIIWRVTPLGIEKVIKKDAVLTFNGTEQVGLNQFDISLIGKAYTISGKYAATDAGTYTVIVRLTPDYMWIDNSTDEISLVWTIERYKITKPTAHNNLIYNTLEQAGVNHTSASGIIPETDFPYNDAYKIAVPNSDKKINAGTYTAVFSLTKNYCWENGATEDEVIQYRIDPFKVNKPIANTYIYDGLEKNSISTQYEWILENENVIVQTFVNGKALILFRLTSGKFKQTNAGEYTTVWTLESRTNFIWNDAELGNAPLSLYWSIGRMTVPTLSVPKLNTKLSVYNGALQAGILFDQTELYYKWRGQTSAINSGSYQVIFNLNSNYCWGNEAGIEDINERVFDWKIDKKMIERPIKNLSVLTYEQGQHQKGVLNIPSEGILISGITESINANQYVASFMLMNFNYIWSTPNEEGLEDDVITISWQIERKAVNRPQANNISYTGESISGIQFDNQLLGEAYSYTGTVSATNIGTYVAYFTLSNNYKWSDDSIIPAEISWTIIGISIDRPITHKDLIYDGTTITGVLLPENWENFYYVVNGSVSNINAGVYSVLFGLKDGIVWSGDPAEARNSYYLTYTIAKKNISEDLSISVGDDQNNTIHGDIAEDYGAPLITYSIDQGVTWTTSKPEKQSYIVKAYYAATDNYTEIVLTGYYEYITPPNYVLIVISILLLIGLITMIIILIIIQRKNQVRIRKLQKALSISDEENNGLLIDQV